MEYRKLVLVGVCGLCWMGQAADVRGEATEAAAVSATAEAAEKTTETAAKVVKDAAQKVDAVSNEVGADTMVQVMADWMKVATPNENHAKLDAFIGTWDVTTQIWMAPGMPPETSAGVSKIKPILEGRFIQENFEGTMQMPGMEPQVFKGFGITGYDNAKGEYTSIWADTLSTAVMASTGQYDDSSKTLTLSSEFDCPMEGPCNMRMTLTVVSPDELKMQGFKTAEGKEEAKAMEIVYKRRY